MKLVDRVAAALDHTHNKAMVGIHTEGIRNILARWLDRKLSGEKTKIKVSLVRKMSKRLESIR